MRIPKLHLTIHREHRHPSQPLGLIAIAQIMHADSVALGHQVLGVVNALPAITAATAQPSFQAPSLSVLIDEREAQSPEIIEDPSFRHATEDEEGTNSFWRQFTPVDPNSLPIIEFSDSDDEALLQNL